MSANVVNFNPSVYRAFNTRINKKQEEEKPVVKVAINGATGRIGKNFIRQWAVTDLGVLPGITKVTTGNLLQRAKSSPAKLEIVAINVGKKVEPIDLENAIRFDSVMGDFPGYLKAERDKTVPGEPLYLYVGDPKKPRKIRVLEQRNILADPKTGAKALPWKELDIDVVVDTTGQNKKKETLGRHLEAGAKKAILSAPAEEVKDPNDPTGKKKAVDLDRTIVYGINDKTLLPTDKLISSASCTTTCTAPIVKFLHEKYGVKSGFIQTTHSITGSQLTMDKVPPAEKSKNFAKMRGSLDTIIPTTTGAAKAIGLVIPDLKGKLNGLSARVPTNDVSMAYVIVNLNKDITLEQLKKDLEVARTNEYKDLLVPAHKGAVSKDMLGRHENAVYVEDQIQVIDNNTVVIPAFYDNEWGYTRSLTDLTRKAGAQLYKPETQVAFGSKLTIKG